MHVQETDVHAHRRRLVHLQSLKECESEIVPFSAITHSCNQFLNVCSSHRSPQLKYVKVSVLQALR